MARRKLGKYLRRLGVALIWYLFLKPLLIIDPPAVSPASVMNTTTQRASWKWQRLEKSQACFLQRLIDEVLPPETTACAIGILNLPIEHARRVGMPKPARGD
jgi:hypothetical protein